MAFIPARGFLGTIKDVVLRGFNIGVASETDYTMRFAGGISIRPMIGFSSMSVGPSISFSSISVGGVISIDSGSINTDAQ